MAAVSVRHEGQSAVRSGEDKNRRLIRYWLYAVFVVLIAIVMVGGATRMTGSGLSITEWKPIHGVIPPLNHAEWLEEFDKYRQIPQYQQINKGMSLEAFQSIFWWEWAHRMLARFVGFLVAIPLAFFWLTGRLNSSLKYRMLGLLALGGFQGAIGWWMVASGLSELTSVSQYRLAIHLTTACVIITAVFYIARGLVTYTERPAKRSIQRFAGWLVFAVLVQIYLGGLVAGLHAGLTYNTWPLMDGAIIPSDLFIQSPWWRNLFENPKTVQFVHRMFAYTVLVLAVIHAVQVWKNAAATTHARRTIVLLGLILVQAAIGIATLLMSVPLDLGLTHQFVALMVLAFAVAHWRATKGAYKE
ncbi:cytochrome oxidase assembly family protein [Ochrobactrum quorumnocens]|uniref:Heme A synthase n=1 Tax=Ochrobactrum quorumnocens TaxID=271865 RepID=A0A248UKE3_9HYPH|nr:COX15/CtaA family protein [[Ochrobactrum] quorumnocens]ASV87307.1 cytochrome oxidase assembly family protein [[Ochrobactrum] quorumnocens]